MPLARARAEEHAEHVATFKKQWTRQAAVAEALKDTLRVLHARIEKAKLDRRRVLAIHGVASRSEQTEETQRAMEETIGILDRLSAMAPRFVDDAPEDEESGEEESDEDDEDPKPPLH